ncbi:transcriptional activator spt7 [Mytilinidion resinicola]|uniref:SAGA complex subunit Spt7 n=1 Tax=Mytilinidion resinicola TaxID=574789 RepID=A0A6A6YXX4_9PEZI|nr:transcriptional activator spt7 [Mytilinidion resinicola]KAF2813671.1 transcriptional activator spt7 [Mytilinidion resinicola]
MSDDGAMSFASANVSGEGGDTIGDEDPRAALFRERFILTEARLMAALGGKTQHDGSDGNNAGKDPPPDAAREDQPRAAITPKKPARAIDEDDYGDDDDGDDEDDANQSPLLSKGAPNGAALSNLDPPTLKVPSLPAKLGVERTSTPSSDQAKSSDDVRKKLQQDKKAAEDAARRSFHTLFYTLENDRDAMLEQQKLDELDRQVETEMSGHPAAGVTNGAAGAPAQQGSLSTANLGASSLTLKHLIARIDAKRDAVHATDAQLRNLISEVRKNRSKWASEDRIGQEELYESMEKVLMELKATEHAHPFLQRVNKREAPDYYIVIKHPMDIGTMMKKLKGLQYKSKKEFVDDLMLIWSNCLKYNADPAHFLRKKALYMKKETEKLVPLIPEIVVRDRVEVEAEERRMRNGDVDVDGVEDSDDEEPLMASRGRKAPGRGNKGGSTARKAPPAGLEDTPGLDKKPPIPSFNNLKTEFLRADSEMEGSINGLSTPPPGTLTPFGPNGIFRGGAAGSQADASEADGTGNSVSGLTLDAEDADLDDLEYKTWKQVTKKDRATIAADRNRMFRGDHLNVEEPAILRTKAGMRRWLRHRKEALEEDKKDDSTTPDGKDGIQPTGETLAEGIEGEDERQVPDYYDPVSAIPDMSERLKWVEDSEGNVINQAEEFMRIVPKGYFTAPQGALASKIEANMRQMQDTRKICAKIGIVKQMQLQSQMYQNQFQKYGPLPFVEADVEPLVVSDDGAIMSPYVCRAALQRSVGKIFYHAGFEEFQPSALEAVTDIAGNFFANLVRTLGAYQEQPKMKMEEPSTASTGVQSAWKPRFTQEEAVLHSLHENGVDLESLEGYVKEDVDRLSTKLAGMHDRMKSHLAELLRPALDGSAGADGAGAFNDGSEQFVGGDFAEDIDEDFFGFKELGLDKEFGLASLSVPLHLLQNRMYNHAQSQNASIVSTTGVLMEEPPKFEPVTIRNITNEIGLVQEWFLAKLHHNNDQQLPEDEDLPVKQRFPKPRLPPTGKISSPRKRPLKEQQQMARKKRKLEEGKDDSTNNANATGSASGSGSAVVNGNGMPKAIAKPVGKLRLEMPGQKDSQNNAEPEKDDGSAVGMISPESIGGA